MNKRVWTEEENEYIKSNWGNISVDEMARTLKLSRSIVQTHADNLKLPKLGYRCKWTDENLEKLRELAKTKNITELSKYFKTTDNSISQIALENNIKLIKSNFHWTEEDISKLKDYSKTMDCSEIANKMNRSVNAIRSLAKRYNIKIIENKNHSNSVWTDDNSRELKELALQGKNILEIAKIMNKKDRTLTRKAKELGIELKNEYKPWAEEDIQKLIELAKTKTIDELVLELEKTSQSICDKAKTLGIKIISNRNKWTEEDYKQLEYLTMIEKKTPKEIAEIMGRTEDSIIIKISRRGLNNQTGCKRNWTEEEETILSDLWGAKSIDLIAQKLNRTVSSLQNKAYELNLGSQIDNNYDGLKISTICDLFNVSIRTVSINWVALGLKVNKRKISKVSSYSYVEINDLFEFLEANQNIWDSRNLEENILGKEPEWLKQKRIYDRDVPIGELRLKNLTKQQLINAKQIILEQELVEETPKQLIKIER